jgi:hypothetical protein
LQQTGSQTVNAEVIFPVSSEAVMSTDGDDTNTSGVACLVPGLSGGEECSTVGGYVTCPFMKMNDLDALQDTNSPTRARSSSIFDPIGIHSWGPPDPLKSPSPQIPWPAGMPDKETILVPLQPAAMSPKPCHHQLTESMRQRFFTQGAGFLSLSVFVVNRR